MACAFGLGIREERPWGRYRLFSRRREVWTVGAGGCLPPDPGGYFCQKQGKVRAGSVAGRGSRGAFSEPRRRPRAAPAARCAGPGATARRKVEAVEIEPGERCGHQEVGQGASVAWPQCCRDCADLSPICTTSCKTAFGSCITGVGRIVRAPKAAQRAGSGGRSFVRSCIPAGQRVAACRCPVAGCWAAANSICRRGSGLGRCRRWSDAWVRPQNEQGAPKRALSSFWQR